MYIYKEERCKVPIKVWAEKGSIEQEALVQAENAASLPFVYKHIAIMPDGHSGYGVPIGSVIASDNVIIPNAVGVDIGCLDKDTEYLTPTGWKKMNKYDNELILQYDKDSDHASFVKPLAYVVKECDKFYHLKNKKGLDQVVSDEHKLLVWKGYKTTGYSTQDMNIHELIAVGTKLSKGYYNVKTTFKISNDGISLSNDEIRLDIMIAADGCVRYEGGDYNRIELHFKKVRKIERAKTLLSNCNISYHENLADDNTVYISFNIRKDINKDLSKYWSANKAQLRIVAEESLSWDGHKGYRSFFSSTKKENADIIQFAFASTNIRAGISISKTSKWNDLHIVTPTRNKMINITNTISEIPSEDGYKYCFTVPSGYFVARRNGRIFITGNCGMAFRKSNVQVSDVSVEIIKKIMGKIREEIPVGFNHHKTPQDITLMPAMDLGPIATREYSSALRQIGTLGGGNHFLELQKDTDGFLSVMVHSGSRNLGKKVCDYYDGVAKKLNADYHSMVSPKWDLAFLPIRSPEGKQYYNEMKYCLAFAKANRALMLDRIVKIIEGFTDPFTDPVLDVHHNYADFENHFGANVLVHRKGAVRAREDELVIIPGSQGTKSYICEGLGNLESFTSCSHGAGRKMGRGQARKTLDLATEIKLLNDQGIVHGIRQTDDLDEAAGAYKSIEEVMNQQTELVKIVLSLQPIAVIKG